MDFSSSQLVISARRGSTMWAGVASLSFVRSRQPHDRSPSLRLRGPIAFPGVSARWLSRSSMAPGGTPRRGGRWTERTRSAHRPHVRHAGSRHRTSVSTSPRGNRRERSDQRAAAGVWGRAPGCAAPALRAQRVLTQEEPLHNRRSEGVSGSSGGLRVATVVATVPSQVVSSATVLVMANKKQRRISPPRSVAPPVPVVVDPLELERQRLDVMSALADSVEERDRAERSIAEQVRAAREVGVSWHRIGLFCGMTGEGARRKWAA